MNPSTMSSIETSLVKQASYRIPPTRGTGSTFTCIQPDSNGLGAICTKGDDGYFPTLFISNRYRNLRRIFATGGFLGSFEPHTLHIATHDPAINDLSMEESRGTAGQINPAMTAGSAPALHHDMGTF